MTAGYDYGRCPICGEPMIADDNGDIDLHTWAEDGISDVHAECCIATGCPEMTVTVRNGDVHKMLNLIDGTIEDLSEAELAALNRLAAATGWRQS